MNPLNSLPNHKLSDKTIKFFRPFETSSARRRVSEAATCSLEFYNQTPPNSPTAFDTTDGIAMLSTRQHSHVQLSTSVENKSFKGTACFSF